MTTTVPTHVLVFPGIRVSGASAFSGPLTHGFPAVTAAIGLMSALKRSLAAKGLSDVDLVGVAPVSHGYSERISPPVYGVSRFHQKRGVLRSNGKSDSVIEEGLVDLTISLVFGVTCPRWQSALSESYASDVEVIQTCLSRLRFAGGSLFLKEGFAGKPWVADGPAYGEDPSYERYRYRLLPGFCLRGRPDLLSGLNEKVDQGLFDSDFDAFLSFLRMDFRSVGESGVSEKSEEKGDYGKKNWKRVGDPRSGWLVPYVCGYADIVPAFEPGTLSGVRSQSSRVHVCEALYGIGEWLGPHRLSSVMEMLWTSSFQADEGVCLYHNCEPYVGSVDVEEVDE